MEPEPRGEGTAHAYARTASMPAASRGRNGAGSSTDFMLAVAFTLWALNYTVVKVGVSAFDPLAFAVLRFGVAGLAMSGFVVWREGTLRVARADLPLLLAIAVLGVAVNQTCFVYSLNDTGATDVALLNGTGPLLTAFLATAIGLERLGRRFWLTAFLGMGGVALIVGGGSDGSFGHSLLPGDGLALGAALCSSGAILPIRRLMQRYSASRIFTYQALVGGALMFPFALPALASQDYAKVTLEGWGALAYAVVLSGVVANLLYFREIDKIGPSRAAMFGYLPVFLGVVFAVVLLGERVTLLQLAGGLVVIGSVALNRSRITSHGVRAALPRSG